MQSNKHEIKATVHLAIPLVIGQLGHLSMSIVDNLMVGNLGAESLAAAAIANSFFYLIMIIGFGISLSITPLTAMYHGSKEFTNCGVVLRQGLLVNMATGVILCGAAIWLAHMIGSFNQPEEIVGPAITYMKTLSLSLLPLMLFQTYRQFAEGISIMRPAMVITIAANFLNIAANWVFIYGHLGAPSLGLTGAGVATFSSRLFMAAAMVYVVVKAPLMKKYDPSLRYRSINWKMMKKLLCIGLPTAVQYFFEVSAFSVSALIIGWIGTAELAAHQIALNLASITYMVGLGVSSAATVRVANFAGNNNMEGARRAGFLSIGLITAIMVCFAAIFIAFRTFLPTLYISDSKVIEITATLLIIMPLFQISDGIQVVGLGISRGIADMKIPTMITFLAYWVIGLPMGYLLGFNFGYGVYGVWIGLFLGLTAAAFMVMIRFNTRSKNAVIV